MNLTDPRVAAEAAFRDRLRPIIDLGARYPEASDVFIDGERITLSFGHERLRLDYADLPGLIRLPDDAFGRRCRRRCGL